MKVIKTHLFFIIIAFVISSCYKGSNDEVTPSGSDEPDSMEELDVPSNFDWTTQKTIDVEVTLPQNSSLQPLIITNRGATNRFFRGFPEDNSKTVNTRITIPTYLSELRLFYNGSEGPTMVTIEGDYLSWDYNAKSAKIVTDDCDLSGFITYSKGGWGSRPNGNNPGVLRDQYFDQVYSGDFVVGDPNNYTITFEESKDVQKYLPGGGGSQVLSQNWTNPKKKDKLGSLADQVIAARLNVDYNAAGFLGSNPNYTLGQLVYKDGPFQNTSVNDFLDMAERALGGGNLNGYTLSQYKTAAENIINSFHEGNNNDILTCPNDDEDGDGDDEDEGEDDVPVIEINSVCTAPDGIFSITNTGEDEMDSPQEYRVFLNGSQISSGSYQLDINDTKEVVVTFSNPGDVYKVEVDRPEATMIYSELTDCGDEDDGGDNNNTTEQLQGTLAYEDLWPGKGDYDFNDLVIDYDFDIEKNNQEVVQHITASFEIKAFGASYHNGFGFTLPNVNPNQITSVTGYDIQNTTVFDLASNGVENGQSKATFIVYDDTYRIMPSVGGIGVNTQLDYDYVEPVTVTLEIDFADNAITYSELDIGSFNPFIVVNTASDGQPGDRGVEIHLANREPSDLFDNEMFGQYNDDSDPATNRYFVTENNLPWGINIAEEFDWVVEKQDITGVYTHFAEWAESGGINYPDWYKDNTGFRNNSLIYPEQINN